MSETIWEYVVQDFSPLLTYFGAGGSKDHYGTNLNPAWEQSCPIAPSARLGTVTVCDLSSTHTTTFSGAGVSLSFYGQAIQLIGNVTEGMEYAVILDNSTSAGNPVNQTLASFSNLTPGYHNVSIIADPPNANSAATLLFESAVVTVGTGLTGAKITRTIVQDNDPSLVYTSSAWQTEWYDDWELQHATENATWHQLSPGQPGGVSLISNAANAVIAHGCSWSFFPSTYQVSHDGLEPRTYFGNSSLQDGSTSHSYLDGIIAFEPNPSGALHALSIDNANGIGYLAIDYFEVITVAGGTPINGTTAVPPPPPTQVPTIPATNPRAGAVHAVPAGVIVGPIVGGLVLLALLGIVLYWFTRRRRLRQQDFEELREPSFNPDLMVRQNRNTRSIIFRARADVAPTLT